MIITDIKQIKTEEELLRRAQWLIGKTLEDVVSEIKDSDKDSRVTTKAGVGYAIEKGFFGIEKNSDASSDIPHLGIEIKTNPLKYNADRTRLSVKEPLSLNVINYMNEVNNENIKQSSLYAKNKKILFILYIHDKLLLRSQYPIKYVFIWEMDDEVVEELNPDYLQIIQKIKDGEAHKIHQKDNHQLTLCPKHNGKFKDPNCTKSKRKQPFNDTPAEIRAFRLKNSYMNKVICRHYNLDLEKGGWLV